MSQYIIEDVLYQHPLHRSLVAISGAANRVYVPSVVGLQQALATAELSAGALGSSVMLQVSSTIAAGTVVSQAPAVGNYAVRGAVVALVVSTGPGPPSQYVTLEQAIDTLVNAGFLVHPVLIYAYSTTVPYGYVIDQQPPAGTSVPPETLSVQLTVSMGKPNPALTASIPNVVGLMILDAMAKLTAANISVGAITWQTSNTNATASVISQSLAAGPTTPYTSVNLVACSGPIIPAVPPVSAPPVH